MAMAVFAQSPIAHYPPAGFQLGACVFVPAWETRGLMATSLLTLLMPAPACCAWVM
jgi:hypothetical protein